MRLSPKVKGETPEEWHTRHSADDLVPIRKWGSTAVEDWPRDAETGRVFHTTAVFGYLTPGKAGPNREAKRSAHHRINEDRASQSRLYDDGGQFKRAKRAARGWGFRRFPVYADPDHGNTADLRLPVQPMQWALPLAGHVWKLVVDGKVAHA